MADDPGLIVIQIDGLSHPALLELLADHRMPNLEALVSDGRLVIDRWLPLLPSCTPASQAGILHGDNDGVPGFRWFEKDTGRLFVANHPGDAAEIGRRLSTGRGLLAHDGVSVGNLLSGDAVTSHLTMATIGGDRASGGERGTSGYPLDPRAWLRVVVAMVRELVAEIVQARQQRRTGVRPRLRRGWRFALERVITNVPLRVLSTAVVIHAIRRGRAAIYVDFTGYDEVAHHCGPGRPEAADAAQLVDRSLGHILDAMAVAPRPYRLVLLSDHGQSLGATFRQRYGTTLVHLIADRIGEGTTFDDGPPRGEYADGLTRIRHHLVPPWIARPIDGLLERRPGRSHHRLSRIADSRGAPLSAPADVQVADVVVCASGNLGLVYLTAEPGHLGRERIDTRYPGLIDWLAGHPGIGMVVVGSARGAVAIGAAGSHELETGRVVGRDPLTGYGPTAVPALRRLAAFEHAGDLIVMGRYDPATDRVVSIEELVGSHGGLGGPQGEAFIAHPADWVAPADPLMGAMAVNAQLEAWRSAMGRAAAG